ncbi:MAG: methyltransferase, partial [Armatimonadetes bacterium]|nr:methyltransferase [Armatimonadota bacterium]
MTSRERVAIALDHREPDRVPLDLGSSGTTGIMVTTYARLRDELGLSARPPKVTEILQMLAEVEVPVLEQLGCDVLPVSLPTGFFGISYRDWKPWRTFEGIEVRVPGRFNPVVDENGDLLLSPHGDPTKRPRGRMPKDGYYFDIIPYQEPLDWDHLDPEAFAEQFAVFDEQTLGYLRVQAEQLFEHTDFALLGGFGGGGLGDMPVVMASEFESPKGIRKYDDFLMAHLTNPEHIKEMYARQTEVALANLRLYHEAVGERIAAIFVSGTDFGSQRGELISPDIYRELYLPFHRKINAWIHRHTSWKTFFHCCGSIHHLIPLFIEAGVDILNPVQCSAADMDAESLKREFGDTIVFWGGGVDTQKTLPFGTPEEVRAEVAERVRTFAP